MKHLRLLQQPTRRAATAPKAVPSVQTQILAAWSELSIQSGWRDTGDWDIPQVHQAIATSVAKGLSIDDAARDLGAARFYQGVGIAEVMTDWNCFLQATGRLLDLSSLQAAVQGWVEASENSAPSACTDPATGLRTGSHIEELLRSIYAAPSTPEQYSTAVVGFPPGISASWTEPGWPTAARIGHELNGLVSAASAAACFVAPQMLILFRSGPDTALMLRHFHGRCLDMLGGAPVDFAITPLPRNRVTVTEILSCEQDHGYAT